jgi:hypothetical protein
MSDHSAAAATGQHKAKKKHKRKKNPQHDSSVNLSKLEREDLKKEAEKLRELRQCLEEKDKLGKVLADRHKAEQQQHKASMQELLRKQEEQMRTMFAALTSKLVAPETAPEMLGLRRKSQLARLQGEAATMDDLRVASMNRPTAGATAATITGNNTTNAGTDMNHNDKIPNVVVSPQHATPTVYPVVRSRSEFTFDAPVSSPDWSSEDEFDDDDHDNNNEHATNTSKPAGTDADTDNNNANNSDSNRSNASPKLKPKPPSQPSPGPSSLHVTPPPDAQNKPSASPRTRKFVKLSPKESNNDGRPGASTSATPLGTMQPRPPSSPKDIAAVSPRVAGTTTIAPAPATVTAPSSEANSAATSSQPRSRVVKLADQMRAKSFRIVRQRRTSHSKHPNNVTGDMRSKSRPHLSVKADITPTSEHMNHGGANPFKRQFTIGRRLLAHQQHSSHSVASDFDSSSDSDSDDHAAHGAMLNRDAHPSSPSTRRRSFGRGHRVQFGGAVEATATVTSETPGTKNTKKHCVTDRKARRATFDSAAVSSMSKHVSGTRRKSNTSSRHNSILKRRPSKSDTLRAIYDAGTRSVKAETEAKFAIRRRSSLLNECKRHATGTAGTESKSSKLRQSKSVGFHLPSISSNTTTSPTHAAVVAAVAGTAANRQEPSTASAITTAIATGTDTGAGTASTNSSTKPQRKGSIRSSKNKRSDSRSGNRRSSVSGVRPPTISDDYVPRTAREKRALRARPWLLGTKQEHLLRHKSQRRLVGFSDPHTAQDAAATGSKNSTKAPRRQSDGAATVAKAKALLQQKKPHAMRRQKTVSSLL